MAPVVLMLARMLPSVVEACEARFDLLRLWEADDPAALLRERGGDVVGVATNGQLPVDDALLDQLPKLQIVAHFGVGYDSVDTEATRARGVVVTNTPDVLDAEVADTALALLLMTVRELGAAERWLRAGRWAAEGPYRLTPRTVSGRRLGILGLGRIGLEIAKRAEPFGLAIAYHNRNQRDDVPYAYHPSLLDLAAAVDTLMIVVPGGAATHHIVDAAVLAALGPDGIVINIGRGSVVDTDALITALQDGTIAAAGLDVYEDEPRVPQELVDIETAVLLPHVGSASVATRRAMGQLVVDNLISWFERGRAVTPVP
ncbi:2-hydroxyacid dehydrogenase [Pseudonocardia sp. CA-107938]|uniref:2-hydroxyacid dehydrogenase n=1 Tax=Pseudonocardia sp. CA-107938 TaxID=3240021 RepID=UPI003D9453F7